MDSRDIENRFTYHAPTPEDVALHEHVRETVREVANGFNEVLPESREKSLAMTHLEEAVMWANAAIARH